MKRLEPLFGCFSALRKAPETKSMAYQEIATQQAKLRAGRQPISIENLVERNYLTIRDRNIKQPYFVAIEKQNEIYKPGSPKPFNSASR